MGKIIKNNKTNTKVRVAKERQNWKIECGKKSYKRNRNKNV